MSDSKDMGTHCGEVVANLVLDWSTKDTDAIDVIECIALSIGCILVNSKVMGPTDTSVRNITAAEAGDMVAEFVEDGFKSTRMMMLEEHSNNPTSK